MGNIKVADYLINLTKFDDIVRDEENRIVLDKYIERVHADKIACHKPHYPGTKEPKRPYHVYRLKSPYATYLAKERRHSVTTDIKSNLDKNTKVHNDAIWGRIFNDCGVNAVEGSVAYQNTHGGKLFYSITQHLKTLTNCNRSKLAFHSPNFFLHLFDMLEHKDEYLQSMTEECFDDLVNAMIASLIAGDTDMHGASTYLLKYLTSRKYTDICRIGLEDHAYDDVVERNGSLNDIKENYDYQSQIYSSSLMSANGRIVMTPRDQIESLRRYYRDGLLSESNIELINRMANYNVNECLIDRREECGARLSQSHADAIRYYMSQAEKVL